jgi:hypothetical protein
MPIGENLVKSSILLQQFENGECDNNDINILFDKKDIVDCNQQGNYIFKTLCFIILKSRILNLLNCF